MKYRESDRDILMGDMVLPNKAAFGDTYYDYVNENGPGPYKVIGVGRWIKSISIVINGITSVCDPFYFRKAVLEEEAPLTWTGPVPRERWQDIRDENLRKVFGQ